MIFIVIVFLIKARCDAFDSVGRALRKASIGLLAQVRGANSTDGTYETHETHGTYRNNMRPAFR
jgi:hypothetical protein